MTATGPAAKSLPLILARELAANLSTPMFLLDGDGTLVYFNDAAELILGKAHGEVGEISGLQLGEMLELRDEHDQPMRRRDSPAGVAFYERCPAHRTVRVKMFDGSHRLVEATAYPLFGAGNTLHGVVTVFWPINGNGA
jgi:PAS domain S-box-containing protein